MSVVNKPIANLTSMTQLGSTDLFVADDTSAAETKKVSPKTLMSRWHLSWYDDLLDAVTTIAGAEGELLLDIDDSSNATVPATISVRPIIGNVMSGTVTWNGPIVGDPTFQWLSGSGHTFGVGSVQQVYPDWWGLDGTADQVEINYALAAVLNKGIIVKCLVQDYDIADSVIVPRGHNLFHMDGAPMDIQAAPVGGFQWSGANNGVVVKVYGQSSNTISQIYGLTIDGNQTTGVTGIKFYDDQGSGGDPEGGSNYQVEASWISVSNAQVGFQIGDRTGDGWSTNFNESVWERLRTYQVNVPLIYDSKNTDDNRISDFNFSIPIGTTARSYVFAVLNAGNTMNIRNGFMRADYVTADEVAIEITNVGGISIEDVNVEGATNGIRLIDIGSNLGRGQVVVRNLHSSDSNFLDSSNNAAVLEYKAGMLLMGCTFSGNVTYTRPITAVNNVFLDGFGFVASGTLGAINEIGTWQRTNANTAIDQSDVYGDVNPLISRVNSFAMTFAKQSTGSAFVDETASSLFTYSLVDDDYVAFRIHYLMYRPVNGATKYSESGEVYITAMSDIGGNITASTPSIVGNQQILDGAASLTVAFSVTSDAGADTITVKITQNNENSDENIDGLFRVDVMGVAANRSVRTDSGKFSWDI